MFTSAAVRSLAESFGDQIAVAVIGAMATAAFAGLAVGLIIQHLQRRREFLTFKTSLTLDMMEVAYGFYTRLMEVARQQHYGQNGSTAKLPEQFEEFRIAARVVEAKLHAYFPDEEARYLWHGVIDMLSIRYYRLFHGADSQRTLDMMATHGKHPSDPEIPANARRLFLNHEQLQNDDTVMKRFEEMLNHSISLVLSGKLDTSPGGDAILQPGRGSRINPIASPDRDDPSPHGV